MKLPSIARSLVLAAALFAPVFAVQPSTLSESDALISLYPNLTVSRGMSPEAVDFRLGKPDAKLAPDVWVYLNFKAKSLPGSERYDALIIGFTSDRVTFLRLSRSEPVRAFIAQQKVQALEQSRTAQ